MNTHQVGFQRIQRQTQNCRLVADEFELLLFSVLERDALYRHIAEKPENDGCSLAKQEIRLEIVLNLPLTYCGAM